jgi:hypothetical protein
LPCARPPLGRGRGGGVSRHHESHPQRLTAVGAAIDPERLECSLRRLRFAFVLGLKDGRSGYRVPLRQRLIGHWQRDASLAGAADRQGRLASSSPNAPHLHATSTQ